MRVRGTGAEAGAFPGSAGLGVHVGWAGWLPVLMARCGCSWGGLQGVVPRVADLPWGP